MQKSKIARGAGFVGALGASALMVSYAASGTGAYFTDSTPGTISATSGHIQVNPDENFNIDFTGLVPGETESNTITYTTDSSPDDNVDIWLHFPDGFEYALFTGQKDHPAYAPGGLGRYGHFSVENNAGNTLFSSYNLANNPDGESGCANPVGHGSNSPATSVDDVSMGYCGVPHYILLEQDLADASTRNVTLSFGWTGRMTDQDAALPDVPFEIVATQAGVRPDAPNF